MEFGGDVKFFVAAEYQCPACKGAAWFYSSLWEGANAAFDKVWKEELDKKGGDPQEAYYKAGVVAGEAMDEYWRECGVNPRGKLPPEEEPCGECEGEGMIRRRVDLREALEWLKEEVSGE